MDPISLSLIRLRRNLLQSLLIIFILCLVVPMLLISMRIKDEIQRGLGFYNNSIKSIYELSFSKQFDLNTINTFLNGNEHITDYYFKLDIPTTIRLENDESIILRTVSSFDYFKKSNQSITIYDFNHDSLKDGQVLIPNSYKDLYHLNVGDQISLVAQIYENTGDSKYDFTIHEEIITMDIVGYYDFDDIENVNIYPWIVSIDFLSYVNQTYQKLTLECQSVCEYYVPNINSIMLQFNNTQRIEDFIQDLDIEFGEDSHQLMNINQHILAATSVTLTPMLNMFNIYVLCLSIAGIFLVCSVTLILMEFKKREIAIYCSLGMKIKKLLFLYFIENMILIVFSVMLSVLLSSLVYSSIFNDAITSFNASVDNTFNIGFNEVYQSYLSVSLFGNHFLNILLTITVGAILLMTIITSIHILMSYKNGPKQLLSRGVIQ